MAASTGEKPSSQPPSSEDPGDENASGKEPLPGGGWRSSSAGFRVSLYFLTIFMAISLSLTFLMHFLEGPEAVEQLAQTNAEAALDPVLFLWLRVVTLPLVLGITVLFVLRIDQQPLTWVGMDAPRGSGLHVLMGCLLATLPLGVWLLLVDPWVESDLLEWSEEAVIGDPWLPLGVGGLLSLSFGFFAIAFLDELIFRGYVYTSFRDRMSWVHAAGLTNLLALALQAGHPEIGAVGLINTFLIGMALAAMREKTGSLIMPTVFLGLWRVLLGCGLSLPVWGSLYPRLFDHQLSGPETLTGGSFGPVGSWLLGALLLPVVAALAWWVDAEDPGDDDALASAESSESGG
ncbi:MAG: type II CAAX endopeptidase family protein [Acidobacteriota bacterium]